MKYHIKIHPRTNKSGLRPLTLFLEENGKVRKRKSISLNLYVKPIFWDKDSERILPPYENAAELNLMINQIKARANDILVRYRLEERPLSIEQFTREFQNDSRIDDFIDFFENEIKALTGTLAYQTIITYKTALGKLRKFRDPIRFQDLNFRFIREFDQFLAAGGKISMNSRSKYHKKIRAVIRSAQRQGYKLESPYIHFKIQEQQTERVFLTKAEMKSLFELYYKFELPETDQEVLRYFLFACFTSLRISDIKELSHSNIKGGSIVVYPRKTRNKRKRVEIPLNDEAKKLLNYSKKGLQFNTISDQKTNKKLKTFAEKCNIHKNITFHVARHTFATLFLELGGKVEVLREVLDHFNIRDTMIYVHITDKEKNRQMSNFDNVFSE